MKVNITSPNLRIATPGNVSGLDITSHVHSPFSLLELTSSLTFQTKKFGIQN